MNFSCDDVTQALSVDRVLQPVSGDSASTWNLASTYNIPAGAQSIRVKCHNTGGPGGFLASFSNGVKTDGSWQCAAEGGAMAPATVLDANGGGVPDISSDANWIWASDSGAETVSCEKTLN